MTKLFELVEWFTLIESFGCYYLGPSDEASNVHLDRNQVIVLPHHDGLRKGGAVIEHLVKVPIALF